MGRGDDGKAEYTSRKGRGVQNGRTKILRECKKERRTKSSDWEVIEVTRILFNQWLTGLVDWGE